MKEQPCRYEHRILFDLHRCLSEQACEYKREFKEGEAKGLAECLRYRDEKRATSISSGKAKILDL